LYTQAPTSATPLSRKLEDELKLYFGGTPDTASTVLLFPNRRILGVFDEQGKLRYLSVPEASKQLGCHIFENPGFVDDLPPMKLRCPYDEESDAFSVSFVSREAFSDCFTSISNPSQGSSTILSLSLSKQKRSLPLKLSTHRE